MGLAPVFQLSSVAISIALFSKKSALSSSVRSMTSCECFIESYFVVLCSGFNMFRKSGWTRNVTIPFGFWSHRKACRNAMINNKSITAHKIGGIGCHVIYQNLKTISLRKNAPLQENYK